MEKNLPDSLREVLNQVPKAPSSGACYVCWPDAKGAWHVWLRDYTQVREDGSWPWVYLPFHWKPDECLGRYAQEVLNLKRNDGTLYSNIIGPMGKGATFEGRHLGKLKRLGG